MGVREVDIAIVGAGPTGLFAAYYAGFRGLSVAVIDALPEPGGQITAMYPEKLIFAKELEERFQFGKHHRPPINKKRGARRSALPAGTPGARWWAVQGLNL